MKLKKHTHTLTDCPALNLFTEYASELANPANPLAKPGFHSKRRAIRKSPSTLVSESQGCKVCILQIVNAWTGMLPHYSGNLEAVPHGVCGCCIIQVEQRASHQLPQSCRRIVRPRHCSWRWKARHPALCAERSREDARYSLAMPAACGMATSGAGKELCLLCAFMALIPNLRPSSARVCPLKSIWEISDSSC